MEHLLKDAGNENVNLYYKFSNFQQTMAVIAALFYTQMPFVKLCI